MANKKPKNGTSNVEATKQTDKLAVNVEPTNTPKKAKKTVKKNQDKPNIFKRMWKGLKGIFSELKKVTWTKGKEVGSNTAVVLVVVVIFFVAPFIIDYVLAGVFGLVTTGHWKTIFIS